MLSVIVFIACMWLVHLAVEAHERHQKVKDGIRLREAQLLNGKQKPQP